jgi:dTDP-4-amino-4,6-dideoxygalactose transaminase
MSSDPFAVVREFERAVGRYTGAPYVVSTTSCTMGILLAATWFFNHPLGKWRRIATVEMPCFSYVGVPMSLRHAQYSIEFRDEQWKGEYQISPLPLWDSARRFTSGMYRPGHMQVTSHHWGKILGLSQGGCILHDDPRADVWLRRARFDGRGEGIDPADDIFDVLGYHAYLSPEVAAHGLVKLALLPKHNDDLPYSGYPDLSTIRILR